MTRVDGSKIRALRRQQERSVEQLAVAAGISPTTLRKIETEPQGRTKPPYASAIAVALGVEIDDICLAESA